MFAITAEIIMSWLVLFVCILSYPTIPLLPVKKLPKIVVTQQTVELDGRSLRVLGAEAQPEKVGGEGWFKNAPGQDCCGYLTHVCPHIVDVVS